MGEEGPDDCGETSPTEGAGDAGRGTSAAFNNQWHSFDNVPGDDSCTPLATVS